MRRWMILLGLGVLVAAGPLAGGSSGEAYGQPVRPPAERTFQRMLRTPELNVQFHRAEAAWKSGASLLEAKTRLDRVLRALPDDQPARKLRAQVLLALGRPAEALQDARRAVALDPDDGEAYVVLCEAARRSSDLRGAEAALDAASRHVFEDPDLHLRLSWNAVELERMDHAEAFARIALVQAPRRPAPYYQLARVFMLRDRPDDAATVLAQGFEAGLLDPRVIRTEDLLRPLQAHPTLAPWLK